MNTDQIHISLFEVVGNTVVERKTSQQYKHTHRDLIEQSKEGNSLAQYKLYQLYSKAMYNICYRMLNNEAEAEDMLQEAFCEALIHIDRFRYESSFGSWLKRIVINRCINNLKKKKADLLFTDDLHCFSNASEMNDDTFLQYDLQKVKKAIDSLSDGYRTIFSLYLLEGYDHGEIAQILNISESTSRSQFNRAKRRVKETVMLN